MNKLLKWLLPLVMVVVMFPGGTAMAKTFKIGVLAPLTGHSAEKGIPIQRAAELFVEQYNQSSGRDGDKLELLVRDDFDDPEKATAVANELVKDEALLAVMGHYYPATALATAKVFNAAKIPFLSPYVTGEELLEANQSAFALNVTEEEQGAFLAVYTKEVLKKDNILLVHNTGHMGLNLKKAFMDKAAHINLTVTKIVPAERELSDKDWAAKNLSDAAMNKQFGAVVVLARSETGLVVLPQLREQGIKQPVVATANWTNDKFLEMSEEYTDGVYVTSPFLWDIANESASMFARDYEKKYHKKPTFAAAMTWDSLLLLSKTIEGLEKPDSGKAVSRASVREFLSNIDWQDAINGVTGMLYFKNKHDKTKEYVDQYLAKTSKRPEGAQETGEAAGSKLADKPMPHATSDAKAGVTGNRSVPRDIYVSKIEKGRYKVAPLQLVKPREEYVLKELDERIHKGYVAIFDRVPYHLVDVVFVGVDIVRITDVNIKDMMWNVDLFMWFKWTSSQLAVQDIEKIVSINASNEKSVLFMEDLSHATKFRSYNKRLTLNTPFNLAAFPFDSQTLRLSIGHMNKNSTHLMLVPDSRHMDDTPIKDIKPQEWDYQGREVFSNLFRYASTFGNPDYRLFKGYKSPVYYSTVNLEIDIKRILQPYLYTFFLPLLIILGINLLILWVPVDQFAPRINASLSGLVGILVYHMSQKNTFPKVGYTMFADYYFLLAYAFVVTMIFSNIVVQRMISEGQKDQAKMWNRKLSIGANFVSVIVYGLMTAFGIYFAE
ncbi:MAG: ABC transporter substrate-binding protein [Magnetococcales bacterium]|nr:ABC transporter substrate-binding protein [Magnetococcales bacterium]